MSDKPTVPDAAMRTTAPAVGAYEEAIKQLPSIRNRNYMGLTEDANANAYVSQSRVLEILRQPCSTAHRDAAEGLEPDVAGLASQIWDTFRDYRDDGGGVPTQEEIEQLIYKAIRAAAVSSTPSSSTDIARNDVYLEAIRAVEAARDEWNAKGRKHWWAQVAQEVIGVLRARAALPPSIVSAEMTTPTKPSEKELEGRNQK